MSALPRCAQTAVEALRLVDALLRERLTAASPRAFGRTVAGDHDVLWAWSQPSCHRSIGPRRAGPDPVAGLLAAPECAAEDGLPGRVPAARTAMSSVFRARARRPARLPGASLAGA
jgi:hypothetical protein